MIRPARRTVATLGTALLVGAGGGAGGYALATDGGAGVAAPAVVRSAQPAAARTTALSVNQIYRTAGPGVVEVTATSDAGAGSGSPFPFGGGGSQQAQGSGFVYDAQGHVVTNEHVVDGATSVQVQLPNGKSYGATVVGSDPSTDLAVLRVDAPASALHPLALGDSSAVQVGDGVVAIGSPFGLEQSVTSGIVSALRRQIEAPNHYQITGAIQTDAAINHGNSGGPLLNLQGKVIGVTAQIESDSGDNAGVGFAIASNTVASVVPQLISAGKVQHAYLGVSIGDAASGGATIGRVVSGGPADAAGLKAGDVVTAVDGRSVADAAALGAAIDAHRPGERVTIAYTRGGASSTVSVTLGTRPS